MRARMLETVGCATTALGFIVLALPYGWNEFTIMSYVAAAALVLLPLATFIPAQACQPVRAGLLGLAALANLDIVRLSLGAVLEVTVFLLIALGLAAAAFAQRAPAARYAVLLAPVGPAVYTVHDIAVGYTEQLPADLLLLVGLALVWVATLRA